MQRDKRTLPERRARGRDGSLVGLAVLVLACVAANSCPGGRSARGSSHLSSRQDRRRAAAAPVGVVWRFARPQWELTALAADDHAVALALHDKRAGAKVALLGASNGELEWVSEVPGCPTWPIQVVVGGSAAGGVYGIKGRWAIAMFDKGSGRPLWQRSLASPLPVFIGPVAAGGKIVVMGFMGSIIALAERDGKVVWQGALSGPPDPPGPVVGEGRMLVYWTRESSSSGALTVGADCVDLATGALLWTYQPIEPGWLRMAMDGGRAFIGEELASGREGSPRQFRVTCLSATDGRVLWQHSLPSAQVFVARRGKLYGVSGKPRYRGDTGVQGAWTASAATGALQHGVRSAPWRLESSFVDNPLLLDSLVVLGVRDPAGDALESKRLIFLSMPTGEVVAQWRYGGSLLGSQGFRAAGGRVYFAPNQHEVVALGLRSRASSSHH